MCLIPLFALVEREALARAIGGRRAARRERAAGLAARWRQLAWPYAPRADEAAKPLLAKDSAAVASGNGGLQEDTIESLWWETWSGVSEMSQMSSADLLAPLH